MISLKNKNSRTEKSICVLVFIVSSFSSVALSQNFEHTSGLTKISALFRSQEPLSLKMSYSNKEVKFETNDSTYIETDISYKEDDSSWTNLKVSIRRRGNFRRKNCLYTPIKMKLKKANIEQTIFEANKKLKLVLPCFSCKNSNDYILKEYLAYKFYEELSPYHYKTRLVNLEYTYKKNRKTKTRELMAILIEDIKSVAKRHGGNVFKRNMNPISHDEETSIQNAFFQYMIANTDFSTAFQHNGKQLFANHKIRPVPYDFDMSGFVNTDYAVVSKVQNRRLPIADVTERYYKGFQRDIEVFEIVRDAFINSKEHILVTIDSSRILFKSQLAFTEARRFILSFFRVLEDDKKFQREIISAARPIYKIVRR